MIWQEKILLFHSIVTVMESQTGSIQVGELVTVKKDTFGLSLCVFERDPNKTIYPWDNTPIKKGIIGLMLDNITENTIFVKVLWTINREGIILYVRFNDLKLLDYDV